jgi:hypothetical protein
VQQQGKLQGYPMKKSVGLILIAEVLLLVGCVGAPKNTIISGSVPELVENTRAYQILDHKKKALDQEIPEWVFQYLRYGVPGIEAMDAYQDTYVFVNKNSGTNFNALGQWTASFTIAQDFPRLVSDRIQARLTASAGGNPDDVYGRFFEYAVKTSSDAAYAYAQQQDDYWVSLVSFQDDGITLDQGVFNFFILITIDKASLQQQLNILLNGIQTELKPTRDQRNAVSRIKETFFEGF